jgi:mono/diheme cytochrome c family protein
MTRATTLVAIGVVGTSASCDVDRPWPGLEPGLERMMTEPRAMAYQANATFGDGRVMRPLPAGAEPYGRPRSDLRRSEELPAVPVPVTAPFLRHGRAQFETYCATCHGIRGDGDSVVADRMTLLKPPSLLTEAVRGYSVGRIYRIVVEGYGMMPSYATELPDADRWAVVSYLRALQLSYRTELSALPPRARAEAEERLQ